MSAHTCKLFAFKFLRQAVFFLVMFSLLFSLVVPGAAVQAGTSVCGDIITDTSWIPGGNDYLVTCNVRVTQGVRLTIQPGTRILINDPYSIQIEGELIADGATFAAATSNFWGRIFFKSSSVDATYDANGNYLSGSKLVNSTILNGGATGVNGAVETEGSSPFIGSNSIRYSHTHGVYARGRSSTAKVVIRGNTITNNDAGGVDVISGKVENNTISDNIGNGGVVASDSTISGNTISRNKSSGFGGGINASASTVANNIITGNQAPEGGGIYSQGSTITGNTVNGNIINGNFTTRGGGVLAIGGTISDNTVNGNSISNIFIGNNGYGGGIYASLSNVTGNHVEGNSSTPNGVSQGGGIFASGGTVSNNTVVGNSVTGNPDSIGYGGGIYADGGAVSNNQVQNNVASGGADSQGGGIYGRLNTLLNNTLTGNSARLGGAIYSYKGSVTNNTVQNNVTALNGTIFLEEATATGNTLSGNSAVNGGGFYGTSATINGNTLSDNSANSGGGIYAVQSMVRGNTLNSNDAQVNGGGIYADAGQFQNNVLTANTTPSYGSGSGVYLSGAVQFTYNSVTGNTASGGTVGGVAINGLPTVQYNNLNNNLPYDVEVLSAGDVSATLNYWGQVACNIIPNHIYDGNDLPGRGKLTYAPSLYGPVALSQMPIPNDLTISVGASSVTLNWSPIPALPAYGCRVPGSSEPDIKYKVWYDTDAACAPYDGTGLTQGNSPIQAGAGTSIVLSGFSLKNYYFSVTATDYLGRESAYALAVIRPLKTVFVSIIKK
jgi:hypothetical protein